MDAVVAAIHPPRRAEGGERKKRKETLADRVEKAVGITMTEEEKAKEEAAKAVKNLAQFSPTYRSTR